MTSLYLVPATEPQPEPRWMVTYETATGREVNALVRDDDTMEALMRWHPRATLTDLRRGVPEPAVWCDTEAR